MTGHDEEAALEALSAKPPAMPIAAAVDRLLKARGLEATAVLADVLACWDETVGHDVAAHVVPVAIRQGELVVEVDEPVWATQVQLLQSLLLARLADHLGPGAPSRLSVRVGRPRPAPKDQVRARVEDTEFRRRMPGRGPSSR